MQRRVKYYASMISQYGQTQLKMTILLKYTVHHSFYVPGRNRCTNHSAYSQLLTTYLLTILFCLESEIRATLISALSENNVTKSTVKPERLGELEC